MSALAQEIDRQLSKLEVADGDILVLRTRSKIQAATAAAWQDELLAMCRAQGAKGVSVIVLDDCTDLAIERQDTRLVTVSKPAGVGKSEELMRSLEPMLQQVRPAGPYTIPVFSAELGGR